MPARALSRFGVAFRTLPRGAPFASEGHLLWSALPQVTLAPTAPDRPPTVIFDFDHTLVRCDSFTWLNVDLLKRSVLRATLFFLLAPLCALCYLSPKTRLLSLSIPLWLATVGMSEGEFREFIAEHVARRYEQTQDLWCLGAIADLHNERARGARIWIATGCAQELAERICSALGLGEVKIVGSQLQRRWGGYVARAHCIEQNKVDMLMARGAGDAWDAAYTDSARDLPLLLRVRRPHLVNPEPRSLRKIQRALGGDVPVSRY